jgi:hypothetical protein
MLSRSDRLSASGDYALRGEVGWVSGDRVDGGRASCAQPPRLEQTEHVGFLADLPVRAVLDGELVPLDGDGKRGISALCDAV